MKINEVILYLESLAHPSLQEHYDNAGLITGHAGWECSGIICSLDATEEVVNEAVEKKCNLIVAHHPIIFGGLKRLNGNNYIERTVIKAIQNNIAIYALHTNLDNVLDGVNAKIAETILKSFKNYPQEKIQKVITCIQQCSFSKSPSTNPLTL